METIEDLLELDEKEIKRRMEEVERNIPTIPGIKYLEERLKEFEAQPWAFLRYVAHNYPNEFGNLLVKYRGYDGNESYSVIIDKLRELYILGKVYYKLVKENQNKEK